MKGDDISKVLAALNDNAEKHSPPIAPAIRGKRWYCEVVMRDLIAHDDLPSGYECVAVHTRKATAQFVHESGHAMYPVIRVRYAENFVVSNQVKAGWVIDCERTWPGALLGHQTLPVDFEEFGGCGVSVQAELDAASLLKVVDEMAVKITQSIS